MEKANVVLVFKKSDKQCVRNYCPESLLSSCSKIFERIIYNNKCNYLIDNNWISQNHSGFKRGGSCINQLISITHDILNSLDEGFKVRGVFSGISKGAYIKYVGGGAGGFCKFFKKNFVAQETIDLNISWPLPSILVPYLRLTCSSISG